MLAALGYWGSGAGSGTPAHVALGVAAPVVVAVLWGLTLSPRARVRLARPWWILLQLVLFALTGAALAAAGHAVLGGILGLVTAGNLAALLALHADGR